MQIHGPTEPIATIPVERYTSGMVVMRLPCKVNLVIESAADCDRLIIAATQAKDLLAGREQPGWAKALPTGHLRQHNGRDPGCTYPGCREHQPALTVVADAAQLAAHAPEGAL
jgi:hypothetical protein